MGVHLGTCGAKAERDIDEFQCWHYLIFALIASALRSRPRDNSAVLAVKARLEGESHVSVVASSFQNWFVGWGVFRTLEAFETYQLFIPVVFVGLFFRFLHRG